MMVGSPKPLDPGTRTGQVNPLLGVLASGDPAVQVLDGTVVLVVEVVVDVDEVELDVVVVPPCLPPAAFCDALAVAAQPPIRPRTANMTINRAFRTFPISPP